ncbi:hypothetical protein HNQ60_002068 [Povalibacter uvarum]|uniref:Aerotolerance regulator N-terminal domain-containing protein n=1 Tax=Povalibacter uvarum TaxID=732238 RepID=A0A841HLM8_9GAMM|nr:BatA and WFA domain-containing protein [Povalibacter uvarum]MBB6093190.1 hypothetical protein [Povalibacter uvarum]
MFLAPAFLAGLLAIALPLWLHRVARANPTRHPFASLMLLEASETQRTAKRTLRYWLLLALRILLLVLLALAFAGPLVSPRAVPVVNPDARLHAIVMDTSLSMRHGERWQRAIDVAGSVIDAAKPGDQLLLVEAGGRRIDVVHNAVPVGESDKVRMALRTIQPGVDRLDYGLLMSTASGWLGTTRLPVELHLISDLQQSAGPLRFADLEPPAGTKPVFHDIGEPNAANTYIDGIERPAAETLAVNVKTSATSIQRREAVLFVDGSEVARRSFQIGPAVTAASMHEGEGNPPPDLLSQSTQSQDLALASAQVQLPLPPPTPSVRRMEVRLEPQDALPQDDRHYAILQHADPRVLVLSRNREADDAVYAAAAIGSLTTPRLVTEQRNTQEVENRGLQNYAAVVVTDVNALSSAANTRITDYVRAGGAALVMLGPGAAERSVGLLADLPVRNVVTQPTRVAQVDTSHPALRQAEGWQDIHFLRHLQITPAASDKVLIELQDGEPLLIERALGAGRLLVLATPLARDWNDFATHPLFVNFMSQATTWLTGAGASTTSSRVGAVVPTGLTATHGGQIFDPEGRRVLNLNDTASADRLIPTLAGFYEIRSDGGVRWLAVNTDIRESNLARMSEASLQRWQSMQRAAPIPVSPESEAPVEAPRIAIGYWVLLLFALLFVAEILYGNHALAVRREVPR